MMIKTILPCLLLWLTTRAVVVLAAESNGWNLNEACLPVGQVSKAYFQYANSTASATVTLIANWGNGTSSAEVDTVEMGGSTGVTKYEFTHTHTTEGPVSMTFISESGLGRVTVPKTCSITAGTSTSAATRFSRNFVAFAAVALSYLTIHFSI
jgi:hypothetical protein